MDHVRSANNVDLNLNFCPPMPGALHPGDAFDTWDTKTINARTYVFWRDYMLNIALNQFEWVDLPDEIDPRYIEMTLLFQGFGCFFEKAPGVLAFCQGAQTDMLDMYYNPQKVQMIAANGSGVWDRRCNDVLEVSPSGDLAISTANAAPCFDNVLRTCMVSYIDLYAHRLTAIDRILDVNVYAQATPWILETDQKGRQDTEAWFRQVTGFEPAIIEYSGYSLTNRAGVLKTDAPFVADKMHDLKGDMLNDVMSMFGTDNMLGEKKERMITGEVDANDEQLALARYSRLDCRRRAAEACNRLFGTSIDVRWKVARGSDGTVDMQDFNEGGEDADTAE